MSRHRGAKHPRRCGLLGGISLLSPAYLLSVERWPFHAGPPAHYDRLSSLLGPSASQSGRLLPLRSEEHTSELKSLMRISYAVFCLKKKTNQIHQIMHKTYTVTYSTI